MMHDPDSATLRSAGDLRMALVMGRTFVLQVAHPDVGAGVAEHSAFRTDPWGRLRAIARSGQRFMYLGEAAARAEGERLRAAHREIAGVRPDGARYHALAPAAYGWVHAVFLDTTLAMHALYGRPLPRTDQLRLFDEWKQGGRLLGLRDRDLPADLDAFTRFFADAVAHTLEHNAVVEQLLQPGAIPPPPPWATRLPAGAWPALWRPVGGASRWLALAALPPAFRAKLPPHHRWTPADARRHRRLAAVIRTTVPRLPARLRFAPDAYRAMATPRV